MKWDRREQVSNCTSLIDVLMLLKEKTMLDTNVATLGLVTDYKWGRGYGIATIKPLPLMKGQKEYTIQAYYFSQNSGNSLESKKNNKTPVLVVFCDRDFINNLEAVQMDTQNPIKNSRYPELHSLKYGVLVQLL